MVQFFVFCRDGAWLVSLAGEDYGPFASEEQAVERAIDSAEVCVTEGMGGKVMLEGRFGCRAVWERRPGEAVLPAAA